MSVLPPALSAAGENAELWLGGSWSVKCVCFDLSWRVLHCGVLQPVRLNELAAAR